MPAGWRERFLQDRRWELSVERRAIEEYSDEERKAEYAALETQRSHLGVFLQMESNAPPRLQRKRPISLPLSTPPPLVLNVSPCEAGAESKDEISSFSCQPSRRPSLYVTIPGTERWLDGSVCYSPLVCFIEPAHTIVIDIPFSQESIWMFRPHLYFSTQVLSAPILIVYMVHTISRLNLSPLNWFILSLLNWSILNPLS